MATQVAQQSHVALVAVYKLNWMLIYYVAILLDFLALSVKILRTRLQSVRAGLSGNGASDVKSVADVLQHHKSELKKYPKHLAVILSKDNVQFDDLSKLIHWAMGLGVEYFSLYDPKGLLIDHRKEFEKYVLSHKILSGKVTFMEAVASQQQQQQKHSSNNNNNSPTETNANHSTEATENGDLKMRNGGTASELYEKPPTAPKSPSNGNGAFIPNGYPRAIRVYYISEADGKPEIAELCRKFSESIKGGKLSIDQINIEFVDSQLREEFNHMPDPDLALYTGNFCCTYGFLPWHIRLTEFIPIGRNLIMQDFLAVLYKYAKKEQRYGK